MKSKFSKLSVALCLIVTLVLTLVPMFAFSASAAENVTASKTMKDLIAANGWTNSTVKQTFKLDDNVTVKVNGGSNSGKAYNNDHIRIYATDSPAGSLTITVPEGYELVSVKVSAKTGTYAFLKIDGSGNDICNKSVAVSGNSVVLKSVKNGSNGKQVQVTAMEVVYAPISSGGDDTCDHANATVEKVAPTCTAKGYEHTVCECGYENTVYTADALGHDYDDGVVTTEPDCTTTGVKTYTCQRDNCGNQKTEVIPANGHDYDENDVCTVCNTVKPAVAKYYIATVRGAGQNYYWMNNSLGTASTKRFQAIDSGATSIPAQIYASDAEADKIFVFEPNDDGTYCIYAEGIATNNYIGWSSGNSAALVAKSSARKFTITERTDGTFNIFFENGTEKRYLSLNSSNGNYFAFYAGTQTQNLALVPVVEKAPVKTEITGATVGLGENLSVYFLATLANAENLENYKMIFTINGRNVEAEAFELNGQYAFVLEGLAPQQMADRIDAKLYEGDEVVGEVEDYTIQKFAETVIADTTGTYTAAEKQLVVDMLYYGKAAQEYVDYYVDYEDGNNTIKAEGTTTDATPKMEAAKPSGDGSEDAYISAAGVQFDFINRLYIKVKGNVTNVKVLINEVEVELTKSGDAWIAYTDAIAANQFATEYKFELYVDGVLAQKLIYSVNAYAFAKWNATNPETQALARALYRYGVAAAAVKTN